jgi:prevent-host-death family protein
MKTIQAGTFKAKCLALLDEVAQTHESLVITKYGKPVAKLVPFDTEKESGEMPLRNLATYVGDIISPIDDEWEAMKD